METSPDHRAQKAATGSSEFGALGGSCTHNFMLLRHAPLLLGYEGMYFTKMRCEKCGKKIRHNQKFFIIDHRAIYPEYLHAKCEKVNVIRNSPLFKMN